ncbi:thiamine pyrophosphate-dependent enzyme, partial [Nocardiopsis alba]|uniref:thiamine pyrophosphate-dependent enzyme n=1 Tax=Nocardiopsis alba TaxID=53437 RepID=UPI0033C26737
MSDTAAHEEPELIQLLTPEGELKEHPDYPLDISAEEIRALYRDLVLVRRVDSEAVSLQRQGELGLWASLLGQEAAQIGSGRALRDKDMAFPSYREHGVAWCRGIEPKELLGMFRAGSCSTAWPCSRTPPGSCCADTWSTSTAPPAN